MGLTDKATALQLRSGTEEETALFTGLETEITVEEGTWKLIIHDGFTPGGHVAVGDQGIQGIQGLTGDTGIQGIQGIQGEIGLTGADSIVPGPTGDTGEQGIQGNQGIQGVQGIQGIQGDQGDSFAVDVSGLLSEKGTYDNELIPFSFLATDTSDLYIKNSDTPGDWSAGIPFGKGEKGDTGDTGAVGASAVAGKIPNAYVETVTPSGTVSAVWEDVPGMSTVITIDEPVELSVSASFTLQTISGSSASTMSIAVNIDDVDHEPVSSRYLSGANDLGIGGIVHRSDILSVGPHTVKLRYRRDSGVSTPGIISADLLVFAMQGAKGEPGIDGADSIVPGPQGDQGIQGEIGLTGPAAPDSGFINAIIYGS